MSRGKPNPYAHSESHTSSDANTWSTTFVLALGLSLLEIVLWSVVGCTGVTTNGVVDACVLAGLVDVWAKAVGWPVVLVPEAVRSALSGRVPAAFDTRPRAAFGVCPFALGP